MKQVFNLVKLFLVILLVSFTSCTNDLAPKTTDFNFSFTLPQYDVNPRSSTESTSNQISDLQKWIINAQIETSEKVLQNITQEGTSGQTITIHFENIQVSQNVRIDIELTPKGEEKPSYKGTSEWFITKKGSNKIHITLKKIQYEIIPDDDNDTGTDDKPEIIIDAAVPQITTQPENVIEIVTVNSGEHIPMQLSVTAQSTDNGTLSFVWQEKNVDNNIWENSTINSTDDKIKSSIKVDVYKGQSRTFKCIITNTNDSVNGNKTATIETNEVTVAYVEGVLTSITAKYIGSNYEKYGNEDFYTDGKVTVTEIYKSEDTQTEVEVTAYNSRYTISPTNNDEKAIGFVPYTVKYNETQNISTKIRVPVKYELKASDFAITSSTSSDGQTSGTSGNDPEKIAQFTGDTVLTVGPAGEISSVPSLIYETENSDSATDYGIMSTGVTSSWKKDSSTYGNTTSITVDNSKQSNSTYNATITPISNSWCVGTSITLNYYIQVCPWKIALNTENENTVDLNNLTGNTEYTLSATNDADENPSVIFTSDNNAFAITNNTTLKTPTATTENQTAKITAKVDGTEIGTLNVTVPGNPEYDATVSSWYSLKTAIDSIQGTYTEETPYVIAIDNTNLQTTSCINVTQPVKIIPLNDVTISRATSHKSQFFYTTAYFEIAGTPNAKITLDGDTIQATNPIIQATSSLSLSYCDFNNNINTSTDGGAICVTEDETSTINVNLSNCNFKNNSVTSTVNGGAVALYGKSIISQINNCTFTNNKATNGGGGALYIYGTTVQNTEKIHTLKDCSFSNNQTSSESGKGGALYLEQGTLILDGITMIGNKDYQNNNSDIFVNNNYCYVTLENNNTIDCFIDQFGSQYNPVIQLGDNFSTESKINFLCVASSGASVEDDDKLITTTQLTSEQIACFPSITDEEGTSWTLNSDGTITKAITGGSSGGTITANVQVSTWSNLKTEIASITGTTYTEENPYVIEITGNMNTEDSTVEVITVSSHVKLVSNSDCTITRTSAFASVNLFQVNSEASLTIGDANAGGTLTLDGGGTDVSATASLIKVSGTLVLNEKSVLQNNNCKEAYGTSGSAVYSNGGTIKVSGATINNNSNKYSSSYGGAIYIKNGTLNITSGLFENNSTYKNGGAIYVTGGTVNITGGEFTNNIVSSGSYKTETGYGGSAIYIDSATTSISSVEFKNNITYDGVGTLLVTNIGDENTPATINNCTFNNNKAYQNGAAIYTGGASYIEITSCNFTENTVTNTDSTTGTGTGEQSDVYIGNNSGWTKIDGTEYSEAWSSN